MRRFIKSIDSLNVWIGKAASFLIVVIAGIVVYEVIARGFFNKPTIWVHELSGMLFGAVFMLGAAYTLYLGEHTRVDILISRLNPRKQAFISIITHLLTLAFGAIVLWKGWEFALRAFIRMDVTDSGWQPLVFPIKFVIVLGILLLLLQLLVKYIRNFYMLSKGNELR